MSTIENGELTQLSVSQMESFDAKQEGGCPRKWWFERVMGQTSDPSEGQKQGIIGHAQLAEYFKTGQIPTERRVLRKAVCATILKGILPVPGTDMLVEHRFSGQPNYHPTEKNEDGSQKWLPLDLDATLWVGGLPWEGFTDLAFRRGPVPVVLDHKFSSDPRTYAKEGEDLIKTVQMPLYCINLMRRPDFADASEWFIAHHYVSRKGVDSFIRSAVCGTDQILERKADIEKIAGEMKIVARITDQNEVPVNLKACETFTGCPHQSICRAFKEKNKVTATKEELDLFAELDGVINTPAPVATDEIWPELEEPAKISASPLTELPPEASIIPAKVVATELPQPPKKRTKKSLIVDVAPGETEAQAIAKVAQPDTSVQDKIRAVFGDLPAATTLTSPPVPESTPPAVFAQPTPVTAEEVKAAERETTLVAAVTKVREEILSGDLKDVAAIAPATITVRFELSDDLKELLRLLVK